MSQFTKKKKNFGRRLDLTDLYEPYQLKFPNSFAIIIVIYLWLLLQKFPLLILGNYCRETPKLVTYQLYRNGWPPQCHHLTLHSFCPSQQLQMNSFAQYLLLLQTVAASALVTALKGALSVHTETLLGCFCVLCGNANSNISTASLPKTLTADG